MKFEYGTKKAGPRGPALHIAYWRYLKSVLTFPIDVGETAGGT